MIRVFGTLLVFAGGVGAWQGYLSGLRRQRAAVEELLYALRRIEAEIRYERKPLLQLAERLERDCRGEAALFFGTFLRLYRAAPEEDFARSWHAAAASLPLPPEGRALWGDVARRLIGDEESVRGSLTLAATELAALQQRLASEWPGRRKVSGAVCFTAAALVVVLFL